MWAFAGFILISCVTLSPKFVLLTVVRPARLKVDESYGSALEGRCCALALILASVSQALVSAKAQRGSVACDKDLLFSREGIDVCKVVSFGWAL